MLAYQVNFFKIRGGFFPHLSMFVSTADMAGVEERSVVAWNNWCLSKLEWQIGTDENSTPSAIMTNTEDWNHSETRLNG